MDDLNAFSDVLGLDPSDADDLMSQYAEAMEDQDTPHPFGEWAEHWCSDVAEMLAMKESDTRAPGGAA